MRINIRHEEKKIGLIFKKTHYFVILNVTFSEEEKAIINSKSLKDDLVLERKAPSTLDASAPQNQSPAWDLTIGWIMRGEVSYACATPLEAKQYAHQLEEKMPELKNYIMANADIDNEDKSFEL